MVCTVTRQNLQQMPFFFSLKRGRPHFFLLQNYKRIVTTVHLFLFFFFFAVCQLLEKFFQKRNPILLRVNKRLPLK